MGTRKFLRKSCALMAKVRPVSIHFRTRALCPSLFRIPGSGQRLLGVGDCLLFLSLMPELLEAAKPCEIQGLGKEYT